MHRRRVADTNTNIFQMRQKKKHDSLRILEWVPLWAFFHQTFVFTMFSIDFAYLVTDFTCYLQHFVSTGLPPKIVKIIAHALWFTAFRVHGPSLQRVPRRAIIIENQCYLQHFVSVGLPSYMLQNTTHQ